jgi:DNA-binding response OmpR family regulator
MEQILNDETVSALLLGEYVGDRATVRDVFRRLGWRLFEIRDERRALASLKRNPVQVVVAENQPSGAGWLRLLENLRNLPAPPQLVVTSRTADDFLWAEVLNRGGFDVLPQPLERDEVERVVAAAGRHFCSQHLGTLRAAVA